MYKKCSEWRRTIGGVGIDQLYTDIDPWDASEPFLHGPINTSLTNRVF